MKYLLILAFSFLIPFAPLIAQHGQRAVTAQSFTVANGTVKTADDDRSVILIASGATVATIAGVSVTMVAGQVIPINAQTNDSLRSFPITVASGTLIVVEVK